MIQNKKIVEIEFSKETLKSDGRFLVKDIFTLSYDDLSCSVLNDIKIDDLTEIIIKLV